MGIQFSAPRRSRPPSSARGFCRSNSSSAVNAISVASTAMPTLGRKLHNELELSEIYRVLEQAIALGARRIILLGGGEPMLYPHVFEVMRFLHDRGMGIDLFSNGTLITREVADDLFRLGVAPVIKLNSMKEEVQDSWQALRVPFAPSRLASLTCRRRAIPARIGRWESRPSSAGKTSPNCRRCGYEPGTVKLFRILK